MKKVRLYQTACGYVRSSAPEDGLGRALTQQSLDIMEFCWASTVILLRAVVEDKPCGGQPKLERLLDRATSAKRPYDLFVVKTQDRLSRDPAKFSHIERRLAAVGVKLVVLETPSLPWIVPQAMERC